MKSKKIIAVLSAFMIGCSTLAGLELNATTTISPYITTNSSTTLNGVKVKKKILDRNYQNTTITPKYIIVHDTAGRAKGADADALYRYFNTPGANASSQYGTDDHQIIQMVPDNKRAWHAGSTNGCITNSNTIGIEMCVNTDGDWSKTLENTIVLVKYLMNKYNIPANRVVRHFDASGKTCPEMMIVDRPQDWTYFKKQIGGYDDDSLTMLNTTGTTKVSTKLRQGPGPAGYGFLSVGSGKSIKVIAKHINGNYKVKYGNNTGYMYASDINVKEVSNIPTTTGGMNFRNGPSMDADVIGYVPKGTALTTIYGRNDKWVNINYNGTKGWISSVYISGLDMDSLKDLDDSSKTTSDLNLRVGPTTAYGVLTEIPSGTKITITGKIGSWVQTSYNGQIGFVNSKYVSNVELDKITDLSKSYPLVNTNANLYSKANTSSEVITKLEIGTKVNVLGKNGTFLQVEKEGQKGWVKSTDVSYFDGDKLDNIEEETLPTTNKDVTLLSLPSANGKHIANIPSGTAVKVLGYNGNYLQIVSDKSTGWVLKTSIDNIPSGLPKIDVSSEPVTTGRVNFRSGPSTNTTVIAQIPKGTKVNVIGYNGTFYLVNYNNMNGWVSKYYVTNVIEESLKFVNVNDDIVFGQVTTNTCLREEASTNSKYLMSVSKNSNVQVLNRGTSWSYVCYNGTLGYMYNKYFK